MAAAARWNQFRSPIRMGAVAGFAAISLSLTACNNAGQGAFSGAAIGTLGGLAIGSLSGNAGEGAIIGLVSGAIAGGVIGDQNARKGYSSGRYEGAHGNDTLPQPYMPNYYDPRYDGPRDAHSASPDRHYDEQSSAHDDFAPDYGEIPPEMYDADYADDLSTEDDLVEAEVEENVIPFYSGPTLYDYDGVLDLRSRQYSYVDTYDDDVYYDGDGHYSLATYASYSPSWSIGIGLSGYYGWCGTCNYWHHNRYTYRCGYRPTYYSYYDNYWRQHATCYNRHKSCFYSKYQVYYPRYSYYSGWCSWRPRWSISIGYSDSDWWWGGSYGYSYYGFYGYYDYWGYYGRHRSYYDCDNDRYNSTRNYKDYPVALKKKYRKDPNRLRRERRENGDGYYGDSNGQVYASRTRRVDSDTGYDQDIDIASRDRRDMLTKKEMQRRRVDRSDDDRQAERRRSGNENSDADRRADRRPSDEELLERIERARSDRRDMVRDRGDVANRGDARRTVSQERRNDAADRRASRSDSSSRSDSARDASERRRQVTSRNERPRSNSGSSDRPAPDGSARRSPESRDRATNTSKSRRSQVKSRSSSSSPSSAKSGSRGSSPSKTGGRSGGSSRGKAPNRSSGGNKGGKSGSRRGGNG
jgi:hypothetical protein